MVERAHCPQSCLHMGQKCGLIVQGEDWDMWISCSSFHPSLSLSLSLPLSLSPSLQFGFRPNHSTEHALCHLCYDIHSIIDNKGYQISVFCYLSKAFDSLSHNILLDKLKVYGIRGVALKWFQSYLGSRMQYTVYNDCLSSSTSIRYGVPQGSILGPILFLLYINDITRCTDRLKFLLFADDTTVYIQGHDLNAMKHTLNQELKHVSNWIKCNKLTLNLSKTYSMLSASLLSHSSKIDIFIDDVLLQQTEQCKFLGIILDCKLKWKPQISQIICRISKLTGIFFKLRNTITKECLQQLYLSVVYPHLLYCASIWGGAFHTYLDKVSISQKKLIRIITFNHRYAHTDPLHDILAMQTYLFVYKSLNSQIIKAYQYMSENPNIGRPYDLKIPLCRTTFTQRFIAYRGAQLWNQLPDDIKKLKSLQTFKTKIKLMLMDSY